MDFPHGCLVRPVFTLPVHDLIRCIFNYSQSVFELGSLFCGIAQWAQVLVTTIRIRAYVSYHRSANFLIFGRCVAGSGAAGIFVSCLSIIAQVCRWFVSWCMFSPHLNLPVSRRLLAWKIGLYYLVHLEVGYFVLRYYVALADNNPNFGSPFQLYSE